MDIKTLSTIIDHVSSATTLNVYAHVTDEMRQKAADCIDRGIAGVEPSSKPAESKPDSSTFQAVKGKYRKPGTGCITQINDHLWEGLYSPKVNGKRIARNIYAATEEECEEKLVELIGEMKRELEPLRARKTACRAQKIRPPEVLLLEGGFLPVCGCCVVKDDRTRCRTEEIGRKS